ncbi:Bax inhibitor 1 like protein [compost metagenome]
MRSGNPTLTDKTFDAHPWSGQEPMTIQGTVNKTLLSLLILVAGASITWQLASTQPALVPVLVLVGVLGGLIVALTTVFKKEWSPLTAPLYAGLEGLALGGISAFTEQVYPGVPMQAVGLTFATLFSLLVAYRSGLIRATENFKLGVVAATGGIALVYLASFVLGFFGITIPHLHAATPIGIAISCGIVVIAALNLVLDFDFIEQGAAHRAPKYMEWYGAFGLMVTLVWLYLEILNLLMKLQGRER